MLDDAGVAPNDLVRLDCLRDVSAAGEEARFFDVTAGEDATCLEDERRVILCTVRCWHSTFVQISK
jgi:hypothetical protein